MSPSQHRDESSPDRRGPPAGRRRHRGSRSCHRTSRGSWFRSRPSCHGSRAAPRAGYPRCRATRRPNVPSRCRRAGCATHWSHRSHAPPRRSAARAGNCRRFRMRGAPRSRPRARQPHDRGSSRSWCRKNTDRASGRCAPGRCRHGRPARAPRRRVPCAGPARRSRCGSPGRSTGPRQGLSRAGWRCRAPRCRPRQGPLLQGPCARFAASCSTDPRGRARPSRDVGSAAKTLPAPPRQAKDRA